MNFKPKTQDQKRLLNAYIRNKDTGLYRHTEDVVDELLEVVYNREGLFYSRLPSAEAKFYAVVLAALIFINTMRAEVTPESLEQAALMILEPAPGLTPDMKATHLCVAGLVSFYHKLI